MVNAYAVGNWGDSAIVEATIAAVRAAGFSPVVVSTADAGDHDERWTALGADAVVPPLVRLGDRPSTGVLRRSLLLAEVVLRYVRFRTRLFEDEAMRAYRAAEVVVAAGGGYLGGQKAGANLIKAMNVRAGIDAGRPTIVAPVTVNPSSRWVERVLRWGLRGATTFSRDDPSLERLRALGIDTELVPDIAIRAPTLLRARAAASSERRVPSGIIGWAPRGYRADHAAWGHPEATQRAILEAIRQVLRSSDHRLHLIAHVQASSTDDDLRAVEAILTGFTPAQRERIRVIEPPSTLAEAVDRYRTLDVLVTSRMHAAIFAMAVGTPALAVAYEPKVHGVMTDLGLADRVLPVDGTLQPESVAAALTALQTAAARERTLVAFDAGGARFARFEAVLAAAASAVATPPGPDADASRATW